MAEPTFVDRLAGWVQAKGQQDKAERDEGGSGVGWIVGLVVSAVAMAAIGFLAWRNWKQGKQLAKLLHERDVRQQEAYREQSMAEMTAHEKQAQKLLRAAREAEREVARIKDEIQEVRDAQDARNREIDALRNWRDVDRYLAGGDG